MNTFLKKIQLVSHQFVQMFSFILTAFLFFSAFIFTCYSTDMESQKVLTKTDNPFGSLIMIFLVLFCLLFFCKFIPHKLRTYKRILFFGVMIIYLTCVAFFVLFGKTVPGGDSMSVYSMAKSLALGDTSVIHPTASYLSYYPQQIGLTAYFEIIIRLLQLLPFSLQEYHIIKCINGLLVCTIILFQYKTLQRMWHNDTADCIYLLFALTNVPLVFYSSFIYSEIPSFAAISMGIYYLIKWLQQNTLPSAVLSLTALALSVLLRKNSLIIIIAILLVLFSKWLQKPKRNLLIYGLLCILFCVTILPCTEKIYELRANNTISAGVPAMNYFAMGMQESSRGNGWYNGFNFDTYRSCGMDTALSVESSKEAIEERLSYFKEHPGYTGNFYLGKYLSQWADGTYACRQATLATFGGRHPFFVSLYEGPYSSYIIAYCNIYQNLLYLGAFLFCLFELLYAKEVSPIGDTSNINLVNYLGLIGVIGGFLFHMIWEANSRYIFLYSLLLLPYAAKGFATLTGRILSHKQL